LLTQARCTRDGPAARHRELRAGGRVKCKPAITKEVDLPSRDTPESGNRPTSAAEDAMEANARSRDRQGKAEDRARRQRRDGMTGEGAEEPDLGQPGDPTARIGQGEAELAFGSPVAPEVRSIGEARQDASADERAEDEGMGEPRTPRRPPHARQ
jgi:hypothetical protein